jgi:hypothetical protein
VVVVWNARHALLGELSDNSKPSDDLLSSIGQPEAVLVEHSRAVHRLAWHPSPQRPGLLLTASQVSSFFSKRKMYNLECFI